MVTLVEEVLQLSENWSTLDNISRAGRISRIQQQYHLSNRTLAAELCCSEALIRHITPLASLTSEQRNAFRGKSTRYIIRALRTVETPIEMPAAGELELASDGEPDSYGVDLVLTWIADADVTPSYAAQVVSEARKLIRTGIENQMLPRRELKPGVTPEEVIEAVKPEGRPPGELPALVHYYIRWLARWTVALIADDTKRYKLLDDALEILKSDAVRA